MGLFSETAPEAPEAPAGPADLRDAQAELSARRADLAEAIRDAAARLGSGEVSRVLAEAGLTGSQSTAAAIDPANLSDQGVAFYVAEARRELAEADQRVVAAAEALAARDSRVTPELLRAFYAAAGIEAQRGWRVVLEGTLSYTLSDDPGSPETVLAHFEDGIRRAGGTDVRFTRSGGGARIERA
jgi:hypothetical protein